VKIDFRIILSNAVADPGTMMIHAIDAFVTFSAVVIASWLYVLAYLAYIRYAFSYQPISQLAKSDKTF
jgi:hypothetical protein